MTRRLVTGFAVGAMTLALFATGGCGVPGWSRPIDRGAAEPAETQGATATYAPQTADGAT